MTTVSVFKAQQTVSDEPVPTLELVAYESAPSFETLEEAAATYEKDAKTIANVLFASLPGGTIDRLLVEMLTRKASHFRVPYGTTEESAPPKQAPVAAAGWRTDEPPRGVRCLVTARGLAGDVGVLLASVSPDHEGTVWFCNSTRLVEVLAWMPMPEPAEPTGLGGRP